jgi:hypothetical protein
VRTSVSIDEPKMRTLDQLVHFHQWKTGLRVSRSNMMAKLLVEAATAAAKDETFQAYCASCNTP